MFFHTILRLLVAGSFALIALAAGAATAEAADVTVTDAKIAGGKLVITGTTITPNTWVRLDGQTARDFSVKSGADGAFAFGVVYHPGDCIVDLQRLISPTALGAATAALVADCGPAGVSPRGAWTATTAYVANDLVTHLGSTWRARRGNANRLPVSGVDWEQFAAAGEPAPVGDEAVDGASPAAAPDGPAGGDLAGTYPNPTIAPGAVTSAKLADFAVTLSKVGINSVNSLRIIDGAIAAADLADFAVTLSKVGINSVNSLRIIDGAIAAADLATGAVTSTKIEDFAVTLSKVGINSVNSLRIIDGGVASVDILDGAVANADLADGAVSTNKLQDGSVTSAKVLDDTQVGGGLAATDLATNSVGSSEIATDAINATEIANDSIDSGEIVDFGLSNQDVGVLFAQVNADGTLANSSGGGVTTIKLGGLGTYEVDFARDVSACAPVVTQGEASAGGAGGAIMGATDRSGNLEAFFVTVRTNANALADRAFHLVVVC